MLALAVYYSAVDKSNLHEPMNDSMEASNQVPPAVLVVRMSALIMVSLPPVLMLM